MSALSTLVRQWRYVGKASNANDEELIRDECADELEVALETAKAFCAASSVLDPISTDDCNVILQDWDESNPDQLVAMRLAAELLNSRQTCIELRGWAEGEGNMVSRGRLLAVEAELGELQAKHEALVKRSTELVSALLGAVERSKAALMSGQIGHINGDMAVYHLEGGLCGTALDACRNALAIAKATP